MFGKIKLSSRSLSTLQLDIHNPRLIGYRKRGKLNTEKDIIAIMTEKYDINQLVNSILTNGFQPDEVLLSIPSESNLTKKTIVEGNRRLTACKIITKPELLSGTKYSHLKSRIKNHKNYSAVIDTIKKLNVVDLASRASARSYIASKHTKESIKRWSVYTQGAYYIDLLNECDNINSLRMLINNTVSASRIKTVVLFSRIADQITELPTLSDIEKEKILSNLDAIKVEAILRLFQRADFKKRIGKIYLNSDGELVVKKISRDAYHIILAKIARDTNFSKSLTTRQENEIKMTEYIESLEKLISTFEVPDENDNDEEDDDIDFNVFEESNADEEQDEDEEEENDNSISPSSAGEQEITAVGDKPIKPQKKNNKLLNKNTVYTRKHEKLDNIIEESKRLNFINYKHSAILLSRTIIQIMLTHIIQHSELHEEYRAIAKQKYLELDSLLDYFTTHTNKILISEKNSNNIKLVKETLSNYKKSGRVTANLATHSESHILTDQEITHIQAKLQILADYFLPKLCYGQ
ncbi:hypothetical protein [Yersinia enterocolitica]